MGWTSHDDFITEITAGKYNNADGINKITGAAGYSAGRWYDMSSLTGFPVANTFPGTALAWQGCDEATGNGTDAFGTPHGGNVSTDTKHLLNIAALANAATGVPAILMLCDMQGYYPGINMNIATAQTLTGTPTLRYTNGAGLRSFLVARATTGATPHNIAYNYNNQAAAAKSNPVTVAATVSAIVPHLVHTGTAANNYGPFLPMASGDTGIQKFNTLTLSAGSGSASTAALVLVKPLAKIPLTTLGVLAERDLMNQLPSLPQIKDGACLTWLLYAGAAVAANTQFVMGADFGWG
jgi:hypothetical protein